MGWGFDGVVAIKGDLFDRKTRGVITLLEKDGYRYEIEDKESQKEILVDIYNEEVKIKDKIVKIKYGYADIFRDYLKERKEDWKKTLFILDSKNVNLEEMEKELKNGMIRYIIIKDQKDLRKELEQAKRDKKIGGVYYVVAGEGKSVMNELITPINLMRDNDKLKLILLTKGVCNELANNDYLSGLRNTEIYSYISCVGIKDEVSELSVKLDGDIYSAIISIEVKNILNKEVFGKDVDYWNIFSSYQIGGEYQFELKGYKVGGNGLIPLELVKLIELK